MSDFPDTQYVDFPALHAPNCPSKCFPQPLGSAQKRKHILKWLGWVAPTEGTADTQDKTSQGTPDTQDKTSAVTSNKTCAVTQDKTSAVTQNKTCAVTEDETSVVTQDIRLQMEKYYRLSHGDCVPTRNETPTPLLGLSHPIGLGVPRSISATTSNVVLDPSQHEGRGRETHAHHGNSDGVQKRVEREEGQRDMHTTTKNRVYMSETQGLHVRDTGFTCERHMSTIITKSPDMRVSRLKTRSPERLK